MSDSQTPYYMRESESEEEGSETETATDSSAAAEKSDTKEEAVKKEVERQTEALRKKVQVGKVELDPHIHYADWSKSGPGLASRAKLDEDGMINIWVDLKDKLPDLHKDYAQSVEEFAVDKEGAKDCPQLNVVIFIVGSRGDVQPYVSLALAMIKSHGHRVRIATHPDFKDFVLGYNATLKDQKGKDGKPLEGRLEFFDSGGDPKALMAYMVKNPGLLPGWEALKNGDITAKRKMTAEMLEGFYAATHAPDPVSQTPFAADAIISNPPVFAHAHIAEALGLPLHMSFTMPWSPTTDFSHPLVNIRESNAEKGLSNVLTYAFADILTWQGLGDVINSFRTFTLGLEPITLRSGASLLDRLKVPWTYCWSEGLIEKPLDWKEHIGDISGFYFLEGDSAFKPDERLVKFLESGDPPIYIGFGSVVVEDPESMTKTIFEAVEKAGARALVSAGWGGLGGADVPDSVFILEGNIPHDWLFADGRVAAVCHHGGAGTTAIGLRNGLPTIVVPFFGDQKFWGKMIHAAAAGPAPIPQKELSVDNLSEAIKFALSPSAKEAAGKMGEKIREEKGEIKGVESFHSHLPLKNMRCDVDPTQVAVWYSPQELVRLSAQAAGVLHEAGKLELRKLEPLRTKEYATRATIKDPVTGGATAILNMVTNHYSGIAQLFYNPPKGVINTSLAIPQGLANLIMNVHEGVDQIPGMLGSDVRQRSAVTDFSSGVKEGAKGVWYGWWDGITGLATEPVQGAQKEGALGFLKGMGRSYINVNAKPAAGILGAMALPISGALQSIRRGISGNPSFALRAPREDLSKAAAKELDKEHKQRILQEWEGLEKGREERAKRLKEEAENMMKQIGSQRGKEVSE